MNKMKFVHDELPLDGFEHLKNEQKKFSVLTSNIFQPSKIRDQLNIKWNSLLNFPEYEVAEDEENYKIKSCSDQLTIATLPLSDANKDLINQIVELMNVAHREGIKQIIQYLDY